MAYYSESISNRFGFHGPRCLSKNEKTGGYGPTPQQCGAVMIQLTKPAPIIRAWKSSPFGIALSLLHKLIDTYVSSRACSTLGPLILLFSATV